MVRKRCLGEAELLDLIRARNEAHKVRKEFQVMSPQKRWAMEGHINNCEECLKNLSQLYVETGPDETSDMYFGGEW